MTRATRIELSLGVALLLGGVFSALLLLLAEPFVTLLLEKMFILGEPPRLFWP